MDRREFIKVASVGACAAALLPSVGGLLTGCTPAISDGDSGVDIDSGKWDFDEVVDRSGTWSIKYGRASENQIPMWIADMDFRTAPAVSSAMKERLNRDVLGYTYTPEEFYQSIIDWEKEMHGWQVDKEWGSYCPGVITSINQAYLTFTHPGDGIIVMPPVYNLFRMYAERLGRQVIDNPLLFDGKHYQVDFDGLEKTLSRKDAKILVLCNPHNPAGLVWDRDVLTRIATLCRQNRVLVISDEIHAELTLYGRRHTPFCSVSEDAAAIGLVFAGPTKSFNLAGVSMTAYCVIPNEELRQPFQKQLRDAKLDEAPIASLVATIAAYTEGIGHAVSLDGYFVRASFGNGREVDPVYIVSRRLVIADFLKRSGSDFLSLAVKYGILWKRSFYLADAAVTEPDGEVGVADVGEGAVSDLVGLVGSFLQIDRIPGAVLAKESGRNGHCQEDAE